MIEHLVDVVRGTRPNELTLDIARHALEIMLAAEQASTTGQAVELKTSFTPAEFDRLRAMIDEAQRQTAGKAAPAEDRTPADA